MPKGSNFNLTTGKNSWFIFAQHCSKYYRQNCPEVKLNVYGLVCPGRRSVKVLPPGSAIASPPHSLTMMWVTHGSCKFLVFQKGIIKLLLRHPVNQNGLYILRKWSQGMYAQPSNEASSYFGHF
jgi:hypothetical protein